MKKRLGEYKNEIAKMYYVKIKTAMAACRNLGSSGDLIVMYNIKDLAAIFGCSETTAYKITKTNGFPSIRLGGKVLTEKRALEEWLEENKGRELYFSSPNGGVCETEA